MTEKLVEYIGEQLMAGSKNVKEVKLITRLNVKGYIIRDGKEAGLDDKQIGMAYIRFAGDYDHEYSDADRKFTSEMLEKNSISKLRLVICHKVKRERDYEQFVIGLLQGIKLSDAPGTDEEERELNLIGSSTDKERIFMAETLKDEENITWNNNVKLLMVDFELKCLISPCSDFEFEPDEC